MDEHKEHLESQSEPHSESNDSRAIQWPVVTVVALALVACIVGVYAYQQHTAVTQGVAHQAEMSRTIDHLGDQVNLLTTKMNDIASSQAAAAQAAAAQAAAAPAVTPSRNGANSTTARRPAATSNSFNRIQSELAKQQKQLSETQDEIAKTRTDLEGNLSSTRDELNGSIAKSHDELVALEQRGERNYFEFDLSKSKQFERSGPVMISLRRTDPKHQNLDLTMIVNDSQFDKKHVNLYEPVWIYDEQDTQPVQVVVNKIDKNRVHGYVSAPKYPAQQASRLQPTSAPVTSQGPAAPAPSN